MTSEILPLSKVKQLIKDHLRIIDENIKDFKITYAKLDQSKFPYKADVWRITLEFNEEGKSYVSTAIIAVNAQSGEIVEYKKGSYWNF